MISIILVEPENPDNIGAVARAMKNMGFSDLRVVNPPKNWRIKARKLAMSAGDVLRQAKSFKNLSKAAADASLVVGTSRRLGRQRGRFKDFSEALTLLKNFSNSKTKTAAILFGKESKGLDNESLNLCDWVVSIPSHEDYPSLNLAQAVMVTCFSLFIQKKQEGNTAVTSVEYLSKESVQETLTHFQTALTALNYAGRPDLMLRIMKTFHGIFKRSGMLEMESQMIKGLSRRIVQRVKQ